MNTGSQQELFYRLKILQCDEPSAITGRIYPKAEVQKAIDKHRLGFGSCGDLEELPEPPRTDLPLDLVSHKVLKMEIGPDGGVWCDIEIMPLLDRGEIALSCINHIRLSPVMTGVLDENNVVSDVTICYTTFVKKEPTTIEQVIAGE